MTKRDTKQKIEVPTRAPRAKGNMFQNLRRPEEVESLSIEEIYNAPSTPPPATTAPQLPTSGTSTSTTTSGTSTTSATQKTLPPSPVAPVRDFMKVANSIGREAVPGGLFSGKSKQLYDYLYSRTRGAITPAMKARISNRDLMQGADINSEITLRANVERLCKAGLISMVRHVGTHEGNEYTVFLPEELSTGTSGTSTTSGTDTSQNLAPLVPLENSGTSTSLNSLESNISGASKTSFKTNTERDDDDAFAGFAAAMKKVAREVTGKEPSVAEAARWSELAEILATELKIAAGRTTVSSVPAFLAEHLRRRLWKKEKRQIESEAAEGVRATKASPKVDASQCPDCYGTSMYYPQGFDKGVARCDHKRLTEAKGTN